MTEDQRAIRGYSILAKGDTPKLIDKETFLVPSQSSDKKYTVRRENSWVCECPDFQKRKLKCKHIYSVEFLLKLRNGLEDDSLEVLDELTQEEKDCHFCKSKDTVKNGNVRNKGQQKQRFLCRGCKRTFYKDPAFNYMRDPKIVSLTLDLYYKGLSLRKISDTLNQFFGARVHHETVRRWIVRFTQKMDEYTRQMKPNTSEVWHVDEQMIKTKGKWVYAWNVLDEGTRFLLASNTTKGRHTEDARAVLKKAKLIMESNPRIVVTDGLNSYDDAIRKEFSTKTNMRPKYMLPETTHVKLKTIRDKPNNNHIERFHSTFRERDKTMRGFKGREQIFADGFRNYYNFVRDHSTLGVTPAVAGGIDLQLGRNRWLSLLRQSLKERK